MPPMNLKFLNNPSQRIATGKSLPLKQLEAIVAYGTAEQRAKVVAKVLPQTYTLSLHKSTHHILTTILTHCDNLVRTQMLYHLRRKLNDMARSPVGNVIVQQLLDFLPNMQRKEIAEAFVLNVEDEELETLCKHPFGNHVAQKFMEFPASADVVVDRLTPMIQRLVLHPTGQRIVAKMVENVENGATTVCAALFPSGAATDDELSSLEDILNGVEESLVLSALLKHPSVDSEIKDGIIACLIEHAEEFTSLDGGAAARQQQEEEATAAGSAKKRNAAAAALSYAEPDFITGAKAASTPAKRSSAATLEDDADHIVKGNEATDAPKYRHNFAYASAIEFGDDAQRKELYKVLRPKLAQFASTKGQVVILLALFKFAAGVAKHIHGEIADALFSHPLCAAAEATPEAPSASKKVGGSAKKKAKSTQPGNASENVQAVALHPVMSLVLRAAIELDVMSVGLARMQQLAAASRQLATSAVAGPVLQRLVEFAPSEIRAAVFAAIADDVAALAQDASGAYLVQQLLEHSDGDLKKQVVDAVVDALCSDPNKALATAQGSRVLQKLVAYASDETVGGIVDAILAGEEDHDDAEEGEEEDEENEEGDDEKQAEAEAAQRLTRKQQREINQKKHYKIRDKRLLSYAVHNHACFAVQALLRETKTRLLNDHRRRLMNSLKPYVFDLAVSPWAGRMVLDAMLAAGSAELKGAIKNVVFMKAENWLSDVPAHAKGQAGIDPTMRQTLRRGREDRSGDASNGDAKKHRTEQPDAPAAAKKAPKRMFRSLKK